MPPVRRTTRSWTLPEPLERLYRSLDCGARMERDAVRFPLRYPDPRDPARAAGGSRYRFTDDCRGVVFALCGVRTVCRHWRRVHA